VSNAAKALDYRMSGIVLLWQSVWLQHDANRAAVRQFRNSESGRWLAIVGIAVKLGDGSRQALKLGHECAKADLPVIFGQAFND
jgi:hypothetical protein